MKWLNHSMKIQANPLFRGWITWKMFVFILGVIILGAYLLPHVKLYPIAPVTVTPTLQSRLTRHLSKLVTIVFRQYEEFENDIAESIQSLVALYPNIPIVVFSQSQQYPPFQFSVPNITLRNVKFVSLDFKLDASPRQLKPLSYISTEYVLFAPDSIRISRRVFQLALTTASKEPSLGVVIGVGSTHVVCQQVSWNYMEWTLQYSKDASGKLCDAVQGQHATLLKTSLLHTLPEPFLMPFPESLYLQTAVRKIKRCYPPVQGTPSYILSGRNTPPCCRKNIRRTTIHVLRALLQSGARCWLETTSLLGAVLRVAYSATNRVYVLILPFVPKNGTMWPADWVMAHQREFPERHLHPLAQIQFGGRDAPAPNDARVFLDLKLGANSLERCQKIGPKIIYP
ncbi:unnamed protein product [Leptidea sinapis]|uniref:FKRP stem domain-containing protein n=1 Tax=Leptidea sinapis TaxID=189913 RepID=A0A5E4R2F5_9NEOP|nr:unnamed protein product [Leptidea sinapis]